MTIKELEQALDMTRANIRFYEREGLLSPVRLENGYRDYSSEDLEALRKIKLLRRLQVPVEDIRAVQEGVRDLSSVLRARESAFTQEEKDLQAARTLCLRMETDGVRYVDMDAARYLEEMERLAREGTRFPTLQADALPTVNRPWIRFFARGLDLCLCGLIVNAVLLLGFRIVIADVQTLSFTLIRLYLAWLLLLGAEPLLLSTWGYTPGKWLFGLKVRDAEGKKLTVHAAWNRTSAVFVAGDGCAIPIFVWYRNYKCFRLCDSGEAMTWEEGCSYTMTERTVTGGISCVVVKLVSLILTVLMSLQIMLPPIKGPLTMADLAKNYSDTARQYQLGDSRILDSQGNWMVQGTRNGTSYKGGDPPDIDYTFSDEYVVEVRLESDQMGGFYDPVSLRAQILVLTFLGSQPSVSPLNWLGILKNLPPELDLPYRSWSVTYGGITISNEVTYSGYENIQGYFLSPIEGEAQTYHRVFTVEVPV